MIIKTRFLVSIFAVFFLFCTTHLVVKDINTKWNEYEKQISIHIANTGTSGGNLHPFKTKLTLKSLAGDSIIEEASNYRWNWDYTPSNKYMEFDVDLSSKMAPENNCLRDISSVTVIADPENINKDKWQQHGDNIKTATIKKQSEPDWPWPVAQKIRFSVQPLLTESVEPGLISLQFTAAAGDSSGQPLPPLQGICYSLTHSNELQPFFSDTITLFGQTAAQVIKVTPGIECPHDAKPILIAAELQYGDSMKVQTSTQLQLPIDEDQSVRMYKYYRNGYLRRHLVQSGRELGGAWLKEFQPGKDRKELLWHSRTDTVGGKTRIYVPWTYTCQNNCTCSDSEPEPSKPETYCGTTINKSAIVQYGGDENPLLNGGLAMSVFADEYLATGNEASLNHAIKLFEYVEKSEWRNPADNTLTGFFLRSSGPGINDRDTKKQYIFASTDELTGMCLGLGNLWLALNKADSKYTPVKARLINLVNRFATQLRDNFYLILPLVKKNNSWSEIGLPLSLQRGWAGTFTYQWFLAKGFTDITGRNYDCPSYAGAANLINQFFLH